MKQWTIQQKIIGWYTLFFLALIIANIIILSVASSNRINVDAVNDLRDVTEEVLEELVISSTGFFLDDDGQRTPFNFFKDGVVFVVYLNDEIVGGVYPAAVTTNFNLQPFNIQRYDDELSNWYIYDVPFASNYTLRGFYNNTSILGVTTGIVQTLILLAPVLLAIAAVGGVFLIRKAFQPLKEVLATTETITQSQNYNLRVPLPTATDDVYRLTASVNAMIEAMQTTLEREKAFSSNVSHELRTPLTNLKAQLEYAVSSKKAIAKNELEAILTQANTLQGIIDQMLEWARVSSSKSKDQEPVDVHLVLESMGEQFQPQWTAKKIQFELALNATSSQILSTPASLTRVFSNLIHNAIKFTPEGGSITVHSSSDTDRIQIEIQDSGIGMSGEQLARVYDPFYQVDTARSHQGVSLGIGLTLTKELIQQDQGTILIQSQLKQGTTVTISYPLLKKNR